jgi:hypothetical protein
LADWGQLFVFSGFHYNKFAMAWTSGGKKSMEQSDLYTRYPEWDSLDAAERRKFQEREEDAYLEMWDELMRLEAEMDDTDKHWDAWTEAERNAFAERHHFSPASDKQYLLAIMNEGSEDIEAWLDGIGEELEAMAGPELVEELEINYQRLLAERQPRIKQRHAEDARRSAEEYRRYREAHKEELEAEERELRKLSERYKAEHPGAEGHTLLVLDAQCKRKHPRRSISTTSLLALASN